MQRKLTQDDRDSLRKEELMRNLTNFRGWQSEEEFLREEADQRQRDEQTIRKLYAREAEVTGKDLLWFFAKIVFWGAVLAAVVILWMAL
jgi:hypothetical protein